MKLDLRCIENILLRQDAPAVTASSFSQGDNENTSQLNIRGHRFIIAKKRKPFPTFFSRGGAALYLMVLSPLPW
ncbi:hypothetical protein EHS86_15625 [Erwinia amylovora]|uniref:Uncharacterized protein n=2 Tax=Erwinia amylovora TaxID=552 RepID=A0A831ERF4_ERWAM|nr:hypothetical protein AD997_13625 [Erwinia amylovora]EKV55077.1 hypothetical protein EaACW_0802 [Erwinia amylovora ACW56400]CBA19744.1 hypothetical protein predicted by Glimmer/Critica [Erwinia amylovora CFBP1430]CBJ47325.1 hypothetical protein EAM_2651 [Erwinia amylovora ATCC 49946]CCO77648.1 hypothetical protein BN432_0821 [Erwinia amylovora Ea356]CCO81432.1 hypothetical protein BN433_0831 [Erwinia amylovora Ea266]CCO85235.1 hypothetical protein BN434_0818 [Erwinia amylovora CFBP 2585]CC